MSETQTLLPCPFCGGSNVKTFGPVGWYREWGISHSCRTFYNGAQELANGFRSRDAAIAAWNCRAPALQPIETAADDGTGEPEAGEARTISLSAKWKPCVHGGGWWVVTDADGVEQIIGPEQVTE